MDKEIPTLQPGSDQRKSLEKKVFQLKTDLQAQAKMKQADLVEREAKILYYTYKEIQEEVANFCKVKRVSVVLAYNSEKADPNNRPSIVNAMNNTVVAQNGVDITDVIIRVLNRPGVSQGPGAVRSDVPKGGTR
jgi:Skp family chaperone for outer membrane proteins